MSQEIRGKLNQDLVKHKNFYQSKGKKVESGDSSVKNSKRNNLAGSSIDSRKHS